MDEEEELRSGFEKNLGGEADSGEGEVAGEPSAPQIRPFKTFWRRLRAAVRSASRHFLFMPSLKKAAMRGVTNSVP